MTDGDAGRGKQTPSGVVVSDMSIDVVNNESESRYEIKVDGEKVGHIDYRIRDGVITMPHTEVDPVHGGKGYGNILVKGALDDVRQIGGLTVRPSCPFIARYIEKNPEYSDLV